MLLETKDFGQLEISQEQLIHFPTGIISFSSQRKFVIIENEDQELPFHYLQSADDPNLCFVIINPFYFKPDYEFDLPKETIKELAIEKEGDVAVFTIVVIPEDLTKMTANLMAPIIINTANRKGKQIILNDKRYKTKHLIMEEIKKGSRGGE
jgi:flagellar assembly factor FliW